MIPLDEFEQELYETAYEGQRWMYLPRIEGNRFGLAITVVGRQGKVNVPLESCVAHSLDAIKSHADTLNTRRRAG